MKNRRMLLIGVTFLLLLAACAGTQGGGPAGATPAPTEASSPTTENPPAAVPTSGPVAQSKQAGSFFAINEIGLGPEGYVSLTNFTNVPVSTQGLYLCQGKECFALPETVIEAGATGKVAVGDGQGLEGVIASKATIGELKPADGEVALFASDKFDDPKALLVYLQWGSTPHTLTKLAVDAGLWMETAYAPTLKDATRLFRVKESGQWTFDTK